MLFLSPVMPAADGNGLAMRVGFFLQAYAEQFDIDLAVCPVVASSARSSDFARRYAARMTVLPHPGLDAHFGLVAAINDLRERLAAFRRFGRPSIAAFSIETARHALSDWTSGRPYDVVHVSRAYLGELAIRWAAMARPPQSAMVLDCDEDDARAYRRLAALNRSEGRTEQAAWAEAEADAFAGLAQATLRRFDLAFVASSDELTSLPAAGTRIVVVPNVPPVSRGGHVSSRRANRTVLFVGTMSYAPNEDAARWLIARVLPRLQRACGAHVEIHIVGSNPSAALRRLGQQANVAVSGTVSDVGPCYHRADLAVVPLRVGGGTRIKILEAAAWGVPIVSTTLGAEGTSFRHGRDLLIADDAQQFVGACARLLRDKPYARGLAARARRRIAWDYDRIRWSRRVAGLVAGLAVDGRADG
jgi:glycosyltransferase involved in cell wall biosynthesis